MLAYLRLGVAAVAIVGLLFLRSHYIQVGRDAVHAAVAAASAAEAQRQGDAKANALQDALARVDTLTKANTDLQNALAASEVLNNAEIDAPCLSDARRLRINATGR